MEQSVVEQRLGKHLFSQQRKGWFHNNLEMVSPIQNAKQI
jgi:hypothetical protein